MNKEHASIFCILHRVKVATPSSKSNSVTAGFNFSTDGTVIKEAVVHNAVALR